MNVWRVSEYPWVSWIRDFFFGPDAFRADLVFFLGLAMLVFPTWIRALVQKAYDKKLADRMARGTDAHFEELRSLKTYRPMRNLWKWRILGFVLVFFSKSDFLMNHFSK